MRARFTTGDTVQTPFGKGVVREVRNNGRLLVDVHGRAVLFREADVSRLADHKGRRRTGHDSARRTGHDSARDPSDAVQVPDAARSVTVRDAGEIDLHGLTVEEALVRVEDALNDALLADRGELRLIHGRSGGRIRAAVHQRLKEIPTVKAFAIDPRNDGVTIVRF